MYTNILIAVALDHHDIVARKIELARHLLHQGGKITLLTVLERVPGYVTEFVDLKPENHLSQRVKSQLQAMAGDAPDIACEVVTGKPGMTIANFANDHGMDLILVGSHDPGVQDYFLGSTASRVVRRAHCSVLLTR
jgi:nucleotide-binding universal stress UspA family protein